MSRRIEFFEKTKHINFFIRSLRETGKNIILNA